MSARGFLGAGDLYIARYNPATGGFDAFKGPYEATDGGVVSGDVEVTGAKKTASRHVWTPERLRPVAGSDKTVSIVGALLESRHTAVVVRGL